jgi:hypothetical protein
MVRVLFAGAICLLAVGCGSAGDGDLTKSEVLDLMHSLPDRYELVDAKASNLILGWATDRRGMRTKFVVHIAGPPGARHFLSPHASGVYMPYAGGWGIQYERLDEDKRLSDFPSDLEESLCEKTRGTVCPP